MKDYRLKIAAALMGVLGFFGVLGIAGDIDYTEQVILRMSYKEYDQVKDTLMRLNGGREPSEREIAHWWAENRGERP